MCVVSAMMDYYKDKPWEVTPIPSIPWKIPETLPQTPLVPKEDETVKWSRETWEMFKEIVEQLRKLDEKLGDKDCEDPAKTAWMKEVEERLSKLEEGKRTN